MKYNFLQKGGHLVAGHHPNRVCPDGAPEPRDVADAGASEDPKE